MSPSDPAESIAIVSYHFDVLSVRKFWILYLSQDHKNQDLSLEGKIPAQLLLMHDFIWDISSLAINLIILCFCYYCAKAPNRQDGDHGGIMHLCIYQQGIIEE